MSPTLDELRGRAEQFLNQLTRLQYEYFLGRSKKLSTKELYAGFPELCDPETFAQLRELGATRPPNLPGEPNPTAPFLEFFATHIEESKAAEANEAITASEASPSLPSIGLEPPLSIREAVGAIPHENSRPRRENLERVLTSSLLEHQALYAQRAAAADQAAQALGLSSYIEMRQQVTGHPFSTLRAECEQVLRQTEDAYRDALEYGLRRVEPGLRPGNASRHDLLRATVVPWLLEHFAPSDVIHATSKSLADWGFDYPAQRRITVDSNAALPPGFPPRAFAIEVPEDIRVGARPVGGIADSAGLLHALGQAQHRAATSGALPTESRRLGDGSVNEGFGFLFQHLLLDPTWHRRYLRLPQRIANEAAQMSAFVRLTAVRGGCAFFSSELTLFERGFAQAHDEFEEWASAALRVRVDPAFLVLEWMPQLSRAQMLRGFALEARLYSVLRQRFNEDFWRNPAAGTWLAQLFSRGQRDDADHLSREFGGPLELTTAGTRLIQALSGA